MFPCIFQLDCDSRASQMHNDPHGIIPDLNIHSSPDSNRYSYSADTAPMSLQTPVQGMRDNRDTRDNRDSYRDSNSIASSHATPHSGYNNGNNNHKRDTTVSQASVSFEEDLVYPRHHGDHKVGHRSRLSRLRPNSYQENRKSYEGHDIPRPASQMPPSALKPKPVSVTISFHVLSSPSLHPF